MTPTIDFYLRVTGIEYYSPTELKVKADTYDLQDRKVAGSSTLYLPISIAPPALGSNIRITLVDPAAEKIQFGSIKSE